MVQHHRQTMISSHLRGGRFVKRRWEWFDSQMFPVLNPIPKALVGKKKELQNRDWGLQPFGRFWKGLEGWDLEVSPSRLFLSCPLLILKIKFKNHQYFTSEIWQCDFGVLGFFKLDTREHTQHVDHGLPTPAKPLGLISLLYTLNMDPLQFL